MKKRVMDLEQYMHTTADHWRWAAAAGSDVNDIVALSQQHFDAETAGIFRNDPIEFSRNLTLAIVTQFYNPKTELVSVARDIASGQIIAYTWCMRNQRSPWSSEEMAAVRIAHCAMDLTAKDRVYLCSQMIRMWEKWAQACEIPIICSSTVRADQPGFLRLHTEAGFDVRGSIAYKRMNALVAFEIDDANSTMVNTTINAKNTSYDADEYNSHSTDHSVGSKQFRAAG